MSSPTLFLNTLAQHAQINVVDTTAAGDSFNAGYLASRLDGKDCKPAAVIGHKLAGAVVQHAGAIIPKTVMPEL